MSLFEQQATEFQRRHIGPNEEQLQEMLATVGANDLEDLVILCNGKAIHFLLAMTRTV